MPNASEEPCPAEVAYAGTWRIEPIESNESVTFALHYPPSSSNRSSPIALAKLGLTTEALGGQPHPLRFEVGREAGTFVCQGIAEDGRGNGAFRFRPDPVYANAIVETGIAPLTLHQHIQAGMFDISSRFVKAIAATGLPHVTFSQLIGLRIFRITPEDVNALHVNFPSASLDDIRALAMSKVTAGYVEALRRANISNLSADNVSALRASGIDQAFIEGLAAKGHHDLSIDDVVRLHSIGE
jgi:hypothetical protein